MVAVRAACFARQTQTSTNIDRHCSRKQKPAHSLRMAGAWTGSNMKLPADAIISRTFYDLLTALSQFETALAQTGRGYEKRVRCFLGCSLSFCAQSLIGKPRSGSFSKK